MTQINPTTPTTPEILRPVSRRAKDITGRAYLSWSQISSMRSCPRRFAFQYVEGARGDFIPASLLFGSAVHAAIELNLRCQLEGIPISASEMLDAYFENWTRGIAFGGGLPVRYGKKDDEDTLSDLAEKMFDAYLASPHSLPAGAILAVEEQVQATLDEELPDVVARVDLVHQDAQAMHVVDFKTARSRWNEEKAADSAEQLLLYRHMATQTNLNAGQPIQLHFVVLTKAKSPVIQRLDLPLNQGSIATIVDTISVVWAAIQAGNFYPNPSPINCTICPFRSQCPAFAR